MLYLPKHISLIDGIVRNMDAKLDMVYTVSHHCVYADLKMVNKGGQHVLSWCNGFKVMLQ